MKRFASIEWLDNAILYVLELIASLSVLFLAVGLIASVANVLTQGAILTNNEVGKQFYAWSQAIGIDAAIPGVIMRLFTYFIKREYVRGGVYTVLTLLVLFTAYTVSDVEAIQQTLNISLNDAYTIGSLVPVSVLVNIRSFTVILLIVSHALRHVQAEKLPVHGKTPKVVKVIPVQPAVPQSEPVQPVPVEERTPKQLPTPEGKFYEAVKAYLAQHPNASLRAISKEVGCLVTTAKTWRDVILQKQASL